MNSALPPSTQEIKSYQKKFREHELRKVLYEVALEKRQNGEIEKAIKIILLGWNWRAYAGRNISNSELDQQIGHFISKIRPLLSRLEKEDIDLKNIDFDQEIDGQSVAEHISDGYNELLKQERINATGASKAMHMLHPTTFMMWDDAIMDAYHKEGEGNHWNAGSHQGHHTRGDGECYLAFLGETQEFIIETTDFGEEFGKDPAKVMDEYNYAKYTLEGE